MTRAPASESPSELRNSLVRIASQERVLTRPIELMAFAADASFYRLVPKAVVLTNGAEEIKALFRFSHESTDCSFVQLQLEARNGEEDALN